MSIDSGIAAQLYSFGTQLMEKKCRCFWENFFFQNSPFNLLTMSTNIIYFTDAIQKNILASLPYFFYSR